MTAAITGLGTTFQIADLATPTVFTTIAEVMDLTVPDSQVEQIDVTNFQSTNNRREFISGLVDGGQVDFTLNWVPSSATDVALRNARGVTKVVKLTFPNGATITFNANLQSYKPTAPTDKQMTADVSFKVSGDVTYGGAAAPANSVLPAISGLAQVGNVLTAQEGTWAGAPAFTYQWKKSGTNISGAVNKTYTPISGDIGAPLTVAVTGTNLTGAATATSAATPNVIA